MQITLQQVAQVGEIIGTVIAIDGIIKQVALKQGNAKLVSICDLIANDLNEVLLILQGIIGYFTKPKTNPNSASENPNKGATP